MDRVAEVLYPGRKVTKYFYDSGNRIVRVEEPSEKFVLVNRYDLNGKLIEQIMNGKRLYRFAYSVDTNKRTIVVSIIGPEERVTKIDIYRGADKVFYSFEK